MKQKIFEIKNCKFDIEKFRDELNFRVDFDFSVNVNAFFYFLLNISDISKKTWAGSYKYRLISNSEFLECLLSKDSDFKCECGGYLDKYRLRNKVKVSISKILDVEGVKELICGIRNTVDIDENVDYQDLYFKSYEIDNLSYFLDSRYEESFEKLLLNHNGRGNFVNYHVLAIPEVKKKFLSRIKSKNLDLIREYESKLFDGNLSLENWKKYYPEDYEFYRSSIEEMKLILGVT
ncbi:MAG: hypothetical protein QXW35_04420 [Candidatus Aenigmatarchaeota archaeon]